MSSRAHIYRRARDAELANDLKAEGVVAPERGHQGKGFEVFESPRITTDERAAIEAHLATKGARHFNTADSGDDFHICAMLRARGHKIFRTVAEGHRSIKYNLDGKVISRAAFIAFVDELRAAMGKPPMGVAA